MKNVRILATAGQGMQVLDATTNKVLGVVGVSIQASEKGMIVNLLVNATYIDIEGVATFCLIHPETGQSRPLQSVVFADGEVWRVKEPS